MTKTFSTSLAIAIAIVGLTACAEEEKGGGAAGSYCEALCDWAADCAGEALGKKESKKRCLEAARAADSKCADDEDGMDIARDAIAGPCIDAFDGRDCDDLTGSEEDVATAAPPAECVTSEGSDAVDAYNEGLSASQPTGDELCEDIGTTICEHMIACFVGDHDLSAADEALDALQAACESQVTGDMVSNCKDVGLDAGYGADTNAGRVAADDCSGELSGLEDSCDIFSEDAYPATCVGSVLTAEELANVLVNAAEFATENGVSL